MDVQDIVWQPLPGAQRIFLTCPYPEVLIHGTRGGGKTDVALMDFAKHVGRGLGQAWRGIYFRRHYGDLERAVQSSNDWFPRIWGSRCKFNWGDYYWEWDTGEVLLFRALGHKRDAGNYQGHEYPWIHWEELTEWDNRECYDLMRACNRTSKPGIPLKISASTNPSGIGHNWVKRYFIDVAPDCVPYTDPITKITRVAIFSSFKDNPHLTANSPNYVGTLLGIKDPARRKAWLQGSWDVTSGGRFDWVWDKDIHVLRPFNIPSSWRVDRAYDWGSSSPFACVWFAESDGTEAELPGGWVWCPARGSVIAIAELYGWNGEPNEGCKWATAKMAEEILKIDEGLRERGMEVRAGPADTQIWNADRGVSIADEFSSSGVEWTRADKSPGSRVNGWERLATYLTNAVEKPIEKPGFYTFDTNVQLIRTLPSLPRDKKNPDDVDKDAEDHIGDVCRYRVMDGGDQIIEAGRLPVG